MEMTVTDTARHLPAACAVCMGHMGPFCDTQVDLGAVEDQNGFGWLYVCYRCVGTMAALFGHITPEAADELRAEIEMGKQYAADVENLLREANASKVVKLSDLQEAGLLIPVPTTTVERVDAVLDRHMASVRGEVPGPDFIEPAERGWDDPLEPNEYSAA